MLLEANFNPWAESIAEIEETFLLLCLLLNCVNLSFFIFKSGGKCFSCWFYSDNWIIHLSESSLKLKNFYMKSMVNVIDKLVFYKHILFQ